METRRFSPTDHMIGEIDNIIKILTVPQIPKRQMPERVTADELTEAERISSARLMRVNHSGEIAAQALYQGQALTAREVPVRAAMRESAAEEIDHLAWCEQRLKELNGRTSLLNPLWYAGSLAIGALAGALGREASLGFTVETEKQVESHLSDHLQRLSPADTRSRAIVERMRLEEMQHGSKAASMGGRALPFPLAAAMRATSLLMTHGSFWV
jgi:ubiquinone biosynthesis monooxygenase Coq7